MRMQYTRAHHHGSFRSGLSVISIAPTLHVLLVRSRCTASTSPGRRKSTRNRVYRQPRSLGANRVVSAAGAQPVLDTDGGSNSGPRHHPITPTPSMSMFNTETIATYRVLLHQGQSCNCDTTVSSYNAALAQSLKQFREYDHAPRKKPIGSPSCLKSIPCSQT